MEFREEEEDVEVPAIGNSGALVVDPDSEKGMEMGKSDSVDEEEESLKQPRNKKRANESASKTSLSAKKAKPEARTGKNVLVHGSESKANLKKQKIHKDKSEVDVLENDEIVLRNEIEEMKKSIKEVCEAMKKLQESQMTKAVLLEVLLKRYHGGLKMELKGSAVDAAPLVKESVRDAASTESAEDINLDFLEVMMSKRKRKLDNMKEIEEMKKSIKEVSEAMEKLQESPTTEAVLLDVLSKETETRKKKKVSCCFECEDAKGNDYQTIFVKGFERVRPRDEIKNALSNFFGSCEEMTRVFVPMECETGVPLRFAFINFRNCQGKEKALKLNGSHIGGRELEVTMARHRDEYYGFTDFNGCDRCLMSTASRHQTVINDMITQALLKRRKRVFNKVTPSFDICR